MFVRTLSAVLWMTFGWLALDLDLLQTADSIVKKLFE